MRLALFDLDHTLLDGDSDQLWCDFLIDKGLLDKAIFSAKNEAMARDYKSGAVDVQAFCEFYIGTLTLKTPQAWEPLRQEFLTERPQELSIQNPLAEFLSLAMTVVALALM